MQELPDCEAPPAPRRRGELGNDKEERRGDHNRKEAPGMERVVPNTMDFPRGDGGHHRTGRGGPEGNQRVDDGTERTTWKVGELRHLWCVRGVEETPEVEGLVG